jgi:hypothetical protein
MPPLQPAQFAALATRANADPGGFSVNVNTGSEPKSGIMVAQAGSERRLVHPTTGGHLENYAHDYAEPLSAPGAHLGTWHPAGNPKIDTDVSQRFTNRQRPRAMREMVMNKQKAAYHVDSGDDINNAVHPANVSTAGLSHKQAKAHVAATRAAQSVFAEGYRAKAGRPSYREESRQLRAK